MLLTKPIEKLLEHGEIEAVITLWEYSEFKKLFAQKLQKQHKTKPIRIPIYPKTSKMNAHNKQFNQTIHDLDIFSNFITIAFWIPNPGLKWIFYETIYLNGAANCGRHHKNN